LLKKPLFTIALGAITAEVIEGVIQVLETIRKGEYKIAIIANADSVGARKVIAACGLRDYFDAIIISEEVGAQKPCERDIRGCIGQTQGQSRKHDYGWQQD